MNALAAGRARKLTTTWLVTIVLGAAAGALWGAVCDGLYNSEIMHGAGRIGWHAGLVAGGLGGVLAAILWCRWTGGLVRRGRRPVRSGLLTGVAVGALAGLLPHVLLIWLHVVPAKSWAGYLTTGLSFGAVTGLMAGLIAGTVLRAEWNQAAGLPGS
ncbi:MAG: hypothetical protein BWX88_03793 [Planctomycetes bacterium ADurb.Bin126]|nr:MAG: hypothetical protein BWX88_03793 [Planctomycetes bacterium ADurb.Bin126]HOD83423.1 hypothetical protein [Phycisphaerae bacterium]HQL75468.1 hypothetical protein [Phycisphaerae bacterium]